MQSTLFDLGQSDTRYPDRIKTMWKMYGRNDGNFCQSCVHLLHKGSKRKSYLKCDKTIITHGAGSDWRAGFPACGTYQGREIK
jgi:hypothetical protein